MSTLATIIVLKIVYKRYSRSRQTESDGIVGNERVKNSKNLALHVLGNLFSQGIIKYQQIQQNFFNFNLKKENLRQIRFISLSILQGQHYFPNHLTIRLAAGAWACGAFFLVQIYCCTLTSHLTALNQEPLINSFFEIDKKPGVTLVLDRGYAIDTIFQVICD